MAGQKSSTDATQKPSIFRVRDLERAREHYRALGFSVRWQNSANTECIVKREDLVVHLTCADGGDLVSDTAYLTVDDAAAVALEWSRPSIGGTTTLPIRTLHGRREGVHCDLDGNLIRFGSNIFKSMTQAS